MKTRFLSILVVMSMLFAWFPANVSASEIRTGSCGDNLTWSLSEDGILKISGAGNLYSYPWYQNADSVRHVIISDGVTDIGIDIFRNYSNLVSVTLPNGIKTIPGNAFSGCSSLKSITIPNSVESISVEAFWGCRNLTDVTLPDKLKFIGDFAFSECTNLVEISLPNSVVHIALGAFAGCTSLTSVTLPDYMTDLYDPDVGFRGIDQNVFMDCTNLNEIVYPDGTTSISRGSLHGCSSLKQITLPVSIRSFSDGDIESCTSLTDVYYHGSKSEWMKIEGTDTLRNITIHYNWGADEDSSGKTPPIQKNPFTDVSNDAYYATPVVWAFDKGITTGTSKTEFSPDAECTRSQVVTFLWRSVGSPEPTFAKNPFADVDVSSWYGKAVLWAVEEGITTGTSATTFSPDSPCTRSQVVTFLHRTAGTPEVSTIKTFEDIEKNWYYNAVLWAVDKNITLGTGDGNFSPNATCTRGQIVTFLYRYMVS